MNHRRHSWLACVGVLVAGLVGPSGSAIADDSEIRDYLSGNGLLNRGLYDLAAAEYRKFLSEHGKHDKVPVARYGLAVCLFRMKQYEPAIAELNRLAPDGDFQYAAEVQTMLGQGHLALEQYPAAAKALDVVAQRHAESELADDATALCAEAWYHAGQYDQSIARSRRLAEQWPDSGLRERAEFFWGLSEMAKAEYPAASKRFTAQLKRFPDGALATRASLLLAQCRHHGGALKAAAKQYRKVIDDAGGRYLADALHGLATVLYQMGEAEKAEQTLDRFLEKTPDGPLTGSAKLLQGRLAFDAGRYAKAHRRFRQVARTGGDLEDDAAYWMAKCKLRQDEHAEAAKALGEAIAKFGDSSLLPEMMYDRAVALTRAGEPDAAIAALTEFRSKFARHELGADALQLLATTEHQQERYDRSQQHCRAFLEEFASHENAEAIAFLSAENDFLGARLDPAIAGYRRYLERYPDSDKSARVKYRIASALYRLERFDEAAPIYGEIVEQAKSDSALRPALLALGDIHFQRGQWPQAERRLSEYLSGGLDVASADEALLKLGLSKQRQERHAEAVEDYDRLLSQFAGSAHRLHATFERGQAMVAMRRFDEAALAFEQLLADGPDSRFASYAVNHLGSIAMQTGDFESAASRYERVAGDSPDSGIAAEAAFQRGQALMAAGQFKPAEGVFREFVKKHAGHDRAPRAAAQLAIAVARQDRHADAVKAIDAALGDHAAKLDPATVTGLQYEKAWCLRRLDKPDEAAKTYRKMLTNARGELSVHAMLELAEIEAAGKSHQSAEKLLKRLAVIIDKGEQNVPQDVREQAAYRLAVCAYELGRFDDAAGLFESFVNKFPKSTLLASASFHCGEALFKTDKHKAAVGHFQRVVDKHDSDAAYGPSLLRLGETLAELQRWEDSEKAFARYLAKFGDSELWFQAQFGVGWALENQARHEEAISAYRLVVGRHKGPTAARAQFQVGECLFAGKRYKEAVAELLKVDIHYAYPEWSAAALYEAGRCFEALSKPVEARHQYKRLKDNYKDSKWASMATTRLSEVTAGAIPGR